MTTSLMTIQYNCWHEEDESFPIEFDSFDKHGTGSGSVNENIQIDGKHCKNEEEQIKMIERVQDPNL